MAPDVALNVKQMMQLIREMDQTIVCPPSMAGAVQAAVDQIPGTLEHVKVVGNPYCPEDKILVFKTHMDWP